MITKQNSLKGTTIVCLLALALISNFATAQSMGDSRSSGSSTQRTQNIPNEKYETSATKHVTDAVAVVHKLESEPHMQELLQLAKGVYIVPTYGRAALGVGASGGSGVLLVKGNNGKWSDPAFYTIGSLNIGLQAGAEGGPIAFILNNDKAVNEFMKKNNFSLSADTGITVVNWAKMAQGTVGTGDVVVWTDVKGLFGDVVTISANDIRFSQNLTNAYYHQTLSAQDIVSGKAKSIPQTNTLKQALAAATGGTSTSSTGSSESTGASGNNK